MEVVKTIINDEFLDKKLIKDDFYKLINILC